MMARIIHAYKSDSFTLNRSTNPIVRLCFVNAIIAVLAICSNASGAEWRGPIHNPLVTPTAPRTNSWFAGGGAWVNVGNPDFPHDPSNEFVTFSHEFVDPAIGSSQTIALGDLNKTFIVGSDNIIVGGGDAVVGNVEILGGNWTFAFQPLFMSGPANSGSLTIDVELRVDNGILRLSGAGSLADDGITGISVMADQVYVPNGEMIIDSEAKLVNNGLGYIGFVVGTTGTATVSGENSMWINDSLIVSGSGTAMLSITNGAQVTNEHAIIATNPAGTGTVTVTGENSTWRNNGTLTVGRGTPSPPPELPLAMGILSIADGGQVTSNTGVIAEFANSTGTATVTGDGSMWMNTGELTIGAGGVGRLTVSDNATVQTATLTIGSQGEVHGDGNIIGNVVNGGLVSPGNSPGSLTIEGDYVQEEVGNLELEFGGLDSSQYDHLIVTGNATLDGDVVLKFIDNFAPQQGQQFEFLAVGGTAELSAATFSVQNLAPGFLFDIAPSAGGYMMTALNDGTFVPEPASVLLLILAVFSAPWRVRRFGSTVRKLGKP